MHFRAVGVYCGRVGPCRYIVMCDGWVMCWLLLLLLEAGSFPHGHRFSHVDQGLGTCHKHSVLSPASRNGSPHTLAVARSGFSFTLLAHATCFWWLPVATAPEPLLGIGRGSQGTEPAWGQETDGERNRASGAVV